MGDMPIGKLLFRLSPPVMLALLIQSIYNIVDRASLSPCCGRWCCWCPWPGRSTSQG